MEPKLQPVSTGERYEILDVLRGFALFGVLFANLMVNVQIGLAGAAASGPRTSLDGLVQVFLLIFVGTKFISIFSFLFGYGFAVQAARARARGTSVAPTYRRRLTWLLAIGLLHAVFLWWGDILAGYALGGFLLLAVRRGSDRSLLTWGLVLALIGLSFLPGRRWLVEQGLELIEPGRGAAHMAAVNESIADQGRAFATGGYPELVAANVTLYRDLSSVGVFPSNYVLAWGLFLLGYLAGRRRLFLDPDPEDLQRFRRWWPRCLGVGFLGNCLWGWLMIQAPTMPWLLAFSPLSALSVLALSGFYVTSLVLIHHSPRRRWLGFLAPVGRMALTNYLSHSVAFVLLLYGVGLGLSGKIGPALCVPIAAAIFALQIVFSRWWLARFERGPVETLWRRWTYGRPAGGPSRG